MTLQDRELQDGPGPVDVAASEPFNVTDSGSANWVVRKVVEARAYADRVEAWAAAEVRRAQNEERFFIDRYGPQLQAWVRQELAARGGRARSLNLPGGQLGFRTAPPTFRTAEPAVLANWCKQYLPGALRAHVKAQGASAAKLLEVLGAHELTVNVEYTVTAAEVKKHVEASGELPPGLVVVPSLERFFVK